MLFQPSNVMPSTLAGIENSTIDVNNNLQISWQINGYSPLKYYQITFYKSNGDIVQHIPMKQAGNFYGTDENGNPNIFTVTGNTWHNQLGLNNGNQYSYSIAQFSVDEYEAIEIKGNTSTETNKLQKGKLYYFIYGNKYYSFTSPIQMLSNYILTYHGNNIISISSITDLFDLTDDLSGETFYFTNCAISNTAPKNATEIVYDVDNDADQKIIYQLVLSTSNYFFNTKAKFQIRSENQNELDVNISTFSHIFELVDNEAVTAHWQLYKDDELVDDTGVISTGKLVYYYNSFENGTYKLKLTITNEYGQSASYTGTINVSYSEEDDDTITTMTCYKDYVELDFNVLLNCSSILPTPNTATFNSNGLLLDTGKHIIYKEIETLGTTQSTLNFSLPYSVMLSSNSFNCNLFSLTSQISDYLQDKTKVDFLDNCIYYLEGIEYSQFLYKYDIETNTYTGFLNSVGCADFNNTNKLAVLETISGIDYLIMQTYNLPANADILENNVVPKLLRKPTGDDWQSVPLSDRPNYYGDDRDDLFFANDILRISDRFFAITWKTVDLIDLGSTDGNPFVDLLLQPYGVFLYTGESGEYTQNHYYYVYLHEGVTTLKDLGTSEPPFSSEYVCTVYEVDSLTVVPTKKADIGGNHSYDYNLLGSTNINGTDVFVVSNNNRTFFYEYIGVVSQYSRVTNLNAISFATNTDNLILCDNTGTYYLDFTGWSATLDKTDFVFLTSTSSIILYATNDYIIIGNSIFNLYGEQYYQTIGNEVFNRYDLILTTINGTLTVISYNNIYEIDNTIRTLMNVYKSGNVILSVATRLGELIIINDNSQTIFSQALSDNSFTLNLACLNTGTSITSIDYQLYANNTKYADTLTTNITNAEIKSLTLFGEQCCKYVAVANGQVDLDDYTNKIYTRDNNTYLLGMYVGENASLQAGNTDAVTLQVLRKPQIDKNATYDLNVTKVRDYSLKSNEKYSYKVMYLKKQNNQYKIADKNQVCLTLPYCELIEAEQTENNVYHLVNVWRFANNIDESSISNNNTPNFLDNFTRYQTKQPSTQMYRSGTLSSLLSRFCDKHDTNGKIVEVATYEDTAQQMEELFNASMSQNDFFVKDMKGNMYKVEIDSPITQTINNKSSKMEVTISVSWRETGSCEGISIISVETDKGWQTDYDEGTVILPKIQYVPNQYGTGVVINC